MILAAIIDLDGTLADCAHRRHFVESKPKDWPAFFAALKDDPINERVVLFMRSMPYHPIIVTGRAEELRPATDCWLQKNGIYPYRMFMRADGDYRPDSEVKKEIYQEHIAPRWEVQLVLDDRSSVVKMWRELGLECWQVAEGNF